MLVFRDLEQKIVKVVNDSGLPIDAIYYIMRSLTQEVEQRYNEYCNMEDAEIAKEQNIEKTKEDNEENNSQENTKVENIKNNEEGAN